MEKKSNMYDFCSKCDNLVGCLELARAPEPDIRVVCPCFKILKEKVKTK